MNWLSWIGRIGFFGFLTSLSVGFGLDAASSISPAVIEVVPQIFLSRGRVVSSYIELAGNDFVAAYEDASGAVLKRPLDPEALFAAGAAANGLDRRNLASSAVSVAARLGWRDIPAQVAVLQGAVVQRQWQAAAPRIAAIVRLDRLDLLPPQAVQLMVDDPVGADALSKEFAKQPNGWSALSSWLAQRVGAIELVRFLSFLPDAVKTTDCASLADQAGRLLSSRDYNLADAVWNGNCTKGHATANVIRFPEQVSDDGIVGPYDWMFPSQGAVSWSSRASPNGLFAVTKNTDPVSRVLAQRSAKLSPGTHSISFQILEQSDDGLPNPPFSRWLRVSVNCLNRLGSRVSRSSEVQINDHFLSIEIPKDGCVVQMFQLFISPGDHPAFRAG